MAQDSRSSEQIAAHGYLGIDDEVVWDIVQTDVPELLPKLELLLESTE